MSLSGFSQERGRRRKKEKEEKQQKISNPGIYTYNKRNLHVSSARITFFNYNKQSGRKVQLAANLFFFFFYLRRSRQVLEYNEMIVFLLLLLLLRQNSSWDIWWGCALTLNGVWLEVGNPQQIFLNKNVGQIFIKKCRNERTISLSKRGQRCGQVVEF